jgi:hypothetical protein
MGLRDQKFRKCGKDANLERATTIAAVSCSSAREAIQNPSSAIAKNRQSIATTQLRVNASDDQPMTSEIDQQPSAAGVSCGTIQHVPDLRARCMQRQA